MKKGRRGLRVGSYIAAGWIPGIESGSSEDVKAIQQEPPIRTIPLETTPQQGELSSAAAASQANEKHQIMIHVCVFYNIYNSSVIDTIINIQATFDPKLRNTHFSTKSSEQLSLCW